MWYALKGHAWTNAVHNEGESPMKLTLTPKLLVALRTIECRRALAINEVRLGLITSWPDALREYIDSLPRACFEDLGLKRNKGCLDALENLRIPDEWMQAPEYELSNFEFGFIG